VLKGGVEWSCGVECWNLIHQIDTTHFVLSVQDHYCLRFEKEMVSLGYIYHRSGSVLVILSIVTA